MDNAGLMRRGYQVGREHNLDEARRCFSQACEASRDEGGDMLAAALTGLGQIERDVGNRDAAQQCYKGALAIYRGIAGPLTIAHTLRHLGDILREGDRLEEAERYCREALALYRASAGTRPLDLANAVRVYALLQEQRGAPLDAVELWREAARIYHAVGVREGADEALRALFRLTGEV